MLIKFDKVWFASTELPTALPKFAFGSMRTCLKSCFPAVFRIEVSVYLLATYIGLIGRYEVPFGFYCGDLNGTPACRLKPER
jgi:hypothetical protein